MNRQQRSKLFFSLYLKEIADNPDAKRYTCYLRAEAQMKSQTGKRQYNKYETFRAAISRAQKERRALLTDVSDVCNKYNIPPQVIGEIKS